MNTTSNPIDQLSELQSQLIVERKALEDAHKAKAEALIKSAHQLVIDGLTKVKDDFDKLGANQFELTRKAEFRRLVKHFGIHFLKEKDSASAPVRKTTGAAKRVTDDEIIAAVPDKGGNQTTISKTLGVSKQAVAPRLKALEASGKVESTKSGTSVIWWKVGSR